MNKRTDELEDTIPETDFSHGVRGRYYERARQGSNLILLEPDVATVFRDPAVVNQALREYLSEHGAPPKVHDTKRRNQRSLTLSTYFLP